MNSSSIVTDDLPVVVAAAAAVTISSDSVITHKTGETTQQPVTASSSSSPSIQAAQLIYDTFKFYLLDNTKEALEHLLLVALVYIVVCLCVYLLLNRGNRNDRRSAAAAATPEQSLRARFPNCSRVLIVTAHPDDESMFFGPTILSLTQRSDCKVYLMCLSNGITAAALHSKINSK